MLPLSLLKAVQNHPMLVELKNGETYNGHLVSCDTWMNIILREVICTSKEGDRFWKMSECYIKGINIKYMRIPDEVIDMVKEETVSANPKQLTRSGPKTFARGGGFKNKGRGGPPNAQRGGHNAPRGGQKNTQSRPKH